MIRVGRVAAKPLLVLRVSWAETVRLWNGGALLEFGFVVATSEPPAQFALLFGSLITRLAHRTKLSLSLVG